MPLASAVWFTVFLMVLFYAVPALSIHLMVWGLADPRREAWDVTPGAHTWKERYRRGAFISQYLNLFLLALFLIQALAALTLARFDCHTQANHTTAAAWNLIRTVEVVWIIGFAVLALGALAALVWAVAYYTKARKENWPDPRRRDALIVHVFIIPLALVLLFVVFGSLFQSLCPQGTT